jgi:hypothetical protein
MTQPTPQERVNEILAQIRANLADPVYRAAQDKRQAQFNAGADRLLAAARVDYTKLHGNPRS